MWISCIDENPFSGFFFLLYNMEIYTSGKPIRIINVVPVYNSHKSDVDIIHISIKENLKHHYTYIPTNRTTEIERRDL